MNIEPRDPRRHFSCARPWSALLSETGLELPWELALYSSTGTTLTYLLPLSPLTHIKPRDITLVRPSSC